MPTAKSDKPAPIRTVLHRIMPRHAPFYFGLGAGVLAGGIALLIAPQFALPIGANALFVAYMTLAFLKLPLLSPEYLKQHARDEDTPSGGIFFVVVVVVTVSVASLFLALSDVDPDIFEVVLSVVSVLLGWFTVQVLGAFHYAYEYYQAPASGTEKEGIAGGLSFPGDDEPDGTAFMYFSFTVGTSVATSDVKVATNSMRRRVVYHQVFSHLYNTIILAAAVNVVMSLGGAG